MASVTERRARQTGGPHAQDLFVSNVNTIEVIGGGLVRVTFFVNYNNGGGTLEPEPADFALVLPLTAMPDGIGKAMLAMGRRIMASEDGLSVRH